ncbi:MAG TPA: protein kinase [Candidatus Paceibacterota bacterium]|nr:protein kinase [Candidatus Paceibacterota bacterium]
MVGPAREVSPTAVGPGGATDPVIFGAYELQGELGRGGMGFVYKARQVALNRPVALKMLLQGRFSDAAFVDRFHLEAEAAAHLDHPNIVPIYEVGQHGGQPFYSMRLIEGRNLAQLNAECTVRNAEWLRRCAELLATIARAAHYAHQRGVLHRDIKPHNILLDAQGQPYLTDFGLAKLLDQEAGLTWCTGVIGSPEFMSPEQAAGKTRQVTTAADVYGLGAVLYALLTGQPVFHADTPLETLRQVIDQEPVKPQVLNPTVDRNLETICLKCLQKEPTQRYASAGALAEDLECWLRAEPIQARRATLVEGIWLWCRRQPVRATLVAALVLVFALGLAGVLWQWQRAERNAQEEVRQRLRAEQNAYAADMNLAQRALQDNNVGLATSLLRKHRPAGSSLATRHSSLATDLRHWEWRYLWRSCQADESVRLQTNSGPLGAVAISTDGRVMAVQTGRDKIAMWDLTSKRLATELPASPSIESLRLSATGNWLAVSTRNARAEPTVEVWDVHARKISRTLDQPSPVRSVAFSLDGTFLATFDNDGTIAVVEWEVNHTLTNFSVPPPRHGGAGVVEFSPDGTRLAIGEDYGRIRILNWRTGTVVAMTNLTEEGTGISALAFSPSTELLATGFDSTIRLWDASSGAPRGQLAIPAGGVQALAFAPDGRRLASAGGDRAIRIWSVADQAELFGWRGHEGEGMVLAFLPDGKTLVSGCQEGTACFWDETATNRPSSHTTLAISFGPGSQAALEAPSFAPEALDPKVVRRFGVAFTPDSQSFITTDPNGWLGVWDAKSVRLKERLPALGSNNWGVALSPEGRWLAAGNASGKVKLWDWRERRLVKTFEVPFEWFGQLRFSRNGKFLITGVAKNDHTVRVRIWRTKDWAEVPLAQTQYTGIWSADLSPDDRILATGHANGAVKLWNFPSGQHVTTITNHTGAVPAVLFSPDGRVLASASWDGRVGLWDVFARRELATLSGHLGMVWAAAFSPDGRRLATGGSGAKDAVLLWDLATQREILSLQGEGEFFFQVAFSPDGRTVMASSFTGVAHLWDAPSCVEIEAAEKRKLSQR